MPIRPFLSGQIFDPETTRIMGVAFEIAYTALRLADRGPVEAIVAQRIIELASAGERNPDLLCERVLFEFAKPALEPAEYHLIDLATGFSHGGFKSLGRPANTRGRKPFWPGKSSAVMCAPSTRGRPHLLAVH